jgi:hypothetical protein
MDEIIVPLDQPAESIPVAVARPPDQRQVGSHVLVQQHRRHLLDKTPALQHSLGQRTIFSCTSLSNRPRKPVRRDVAPHGLWHREQGSIAPKIG